MPSSVLTLQSLHINLPKLISSLLNLACHFLNSLNVSLKTDKRKRSGCLQHVPFLQFNERSDHRRIYYVLKKCSTCSVVGSEFRESYVCLHLLSLYQLLVLFETQHAFSIAINVANIRKAYYSDKR